MIMSYSLYSKPFKPPADLVKDLQAKGLRIKDVNKAERILADINYYRFKIYLVPLQNSGSKIFKPNAVFEDAVQLYRFDDELRDLLFSAIGRIEIKLRSKLDQVVCSHTQNPFWYLDRGLFGTGFYNVESTLSKLASDFQRSKDDYSVHFKSRYFNDQHDGFKQLPPF